MALPTKQNPPITNPEVDKLKAQLMEYQQRVQQVEEENKSLQDSIAFQNLADEKTRWLLLIQATNSVATSIKELKQTIIDLSSQNEVPQQEEMSNEEIG